MPLGRKGGVYLIAEIGLNHNGSLNTALHMCKVASDAGFDAVKFQIRDVDLLYSPETLKQKQKSPYGTTVRDIKEGRELSYDDYVAIKGYCSQHNTLDVFASVWDVRSLQKAVYLGFPYIKIPSAKNNDDGLLIAAADTGKPLILSTGMVDQHRLDCMLDLIYKHGGIVACLNHCVSAYPCPPEALNYKTIKVLQNKYPNLRIGYSGHEECVDLTPMLVGLGVDSIERHVTLDKSAYGDDHAFSLMPDEQAEFVRLARKAEHAMGTGELTNDFVEEFDVTRLRQGKRLSGVPDINFGAAS